MIEDQVAFPTLDDSEIAAIEPLGTRRSISTGDYLYREGDAHYDFYVVVSGTVEVAVHADGEERVVARFGPRNFMGELSLLSGQRVYVSARVADPGEVIVVPADALRQVFVARPKLADTILAAFLARRERLVRDATTAVRVIGSRFSPDSLRRGISSTGLKPTQRPAAVGGGRASLLVRGSGQFASRPRNGWRPRRLPWTRLRSRSEEQLRSTVVRPLRGTPRL